MGRRRKQAARTLVIIVQDKSGSMNNRTNATISGFNEYKNTLRREASGRVLLTLTQFDTRVNRIHSAVPIEDVPDLNSGSYIPGGMTALYDAVGQAIRDTEHVVRSNDKVLVVVMTDGGENSSNEWRKDAILSLLENKRAQRWEFIFLGAGEEAWATGQSLGFDYSSSINYNSTPAAAAAVYRAAAVSTSDYMRGTPMAQSMSSNTLKTSLENDAFGISPNTNTNTSTSSAANFTVNLWNPGVKDDDDTDSKTAA